MPAKKKPKKVKLPSLAKVNAKTNKSYKDFIDAALLKNPGLVASFVPGQNLLNANLLRIHGNDQPKNAIEGYRQQSLLGDAQKKQIIDKIIKYNSKAGPSATQAELDALGPADLGVPNPDYRTAVENDPRFKALAAHYDALPQSSLDRNLALVASKSIANIPSVARRLHPYSGLPAGVGINYGSSEGINLYSNPIKNPNANGNMDFYDSEDSSPTEQQIVLTPHPEQKLNPITAFIHEGRHAIDDLYRRPQQKEMINFLAEQERLKGVTPSTGSRKGWLKGLLEGAQEAIVHPDFQKNHGYKFFEDDVDKSLANLSVSKIQTSPKNPGLFGLQDARNTLNNIRANPNTGDPGDAFKSLSELNAYMMERLGTGWVQPQDNAGRRLMKENLRTAYRDDEELLGGGNGGTPNSLATVAPNVHKAYFDRYNELRNPKYVASSINDDPKRMQDAAAKIGVTHAEAPLDAVPGTKKELTAFTPPNIPNPFPAPKYTNRAKGGRVTGKNLLSRFKKPKRKAS